MAKAKLKLCLHCSRLIGDDVYLLQAEFALNRAAPDGLQNICRMSKSERVRNTTHPDRLPNGEHPRRVPTPADAPFVDLYAHHPTRRKQARPRPPSVAQLRVGWDFLYANPFGRSR